MDPWTASVLASYGRSVKFCRAYVSGTFDCLHRGHLNLFTMARRIATHVTASVNTDAFTTRFKRPPLMPLADRLAVLNACRLVDDVILNDGDEDSRPAILRSGADCIVHGSDIVGVALERQMGFTAQWLAENGIALVILPYTEFVSTTAILRAAGLER